MHACIPSSSLLLATSRSKLVKCAAKAVVAVGPQLGLGGQALVAQLGLHVAAGWQVGCPLRALCNLVPLDAVMVNRGRRRRRKWGGGVINVDWGFFILLLAPLSGPFFSLGRTPYVALKKGWLRMSPRPPCMHPSRRVRSGCSRPLMSDRSLSEYCLLGNREVGVEINIGGAIIKGRKLYKGRTGRVQRGRIT